MYRLSFKFIVIKLILISLGAGIMFSSSQFFKNDQSTDLLSEYPFFSRLPKKAVDVLTLGNGRVYNIYLYLYTLQIFASEKVKNVDPVRFANWSKEVLKQLPEIEGTYALACYTLVIDLERGDLCEDITKLGMKAMPDSWMIPVIQGWVHLFKRLELKEAAYYYGIASEIRGSPAYLKSLVKKIKSGKILENSEVKKLHDEMIKIEKKLKSSNKESL